MGIVEPYGALLLYIGLMGLFAEAVGGKSLCRHGTWYVQGQVAREQKLNWRQPQFTN